MPHLMEFQLLLTLVIITLNGTYFCFVIQYFFCIKSKFASKDQHKNSFYSQNMKIIEFKEAFKLLTALQTDYEAYNYFVKLSNKSDCLTKVYYKIAL